MARRPLTIPGALDKLEDAIEALERNTKKYTDALNALEMVLKNAPVADALPFKGDYADLLQRIEIIKESL